MRRLLLLVPLAALLVACGDDPAAPVGARPYAECIAVTSYVPTAGWRSNCPSALGMDTVPLRHALDDAQANMPGLLALVVARKGYIALEAYWRGTRASTPLDIRSVTKAVTASVVATEIRAGRIPGMEEPLVTYWSWLASTDDPRRATLTVRHLLDLSAGFDMSAPGQSTFDTPSWYLTRPLRWNPGEHWQYDEGLYDVLSSLVRVVDARGMREVARAELFAPLGIAAAASRWPVNGAGDAYGASGLRLTAREMLSLGELYRRDGMWDGQQVLPANWVAPMRVRPTGLADDMQVWFRGWRQVVLHGHLALFTVGYGGQYIVVVPDLDLVIAAGSRANVGEVAWPQVLPADWVAPMRVRPAGLADDMQVWFRGWRQVVLHGHLALFTIGYGGQYIVVVPDLDLVIAAGSRANVGEVAWPQVLRLVGDYVIPASSALE